MGDSLSYLIVRPIIERWIFFKYCKRKKNNIARGYGCMGLLVRHIICGLRTNFNIMLLVSFNVYLSDR